MDAKITTTEDELNANQAPRQRIKFDEQTETYRKKFCDSVSGKKYL